MRQDGLRLGTRTTGGKQAGGNLDAASRAVSAGEWSRWPFHLHLDRTLKHFNPVQQVLFAAAVILDQLPIACPRSLLYRDFHKLPEQHDLCDRPSVLTSCPSLLGKSIAFGLETGTRCPCAYVLARGRVNIGFFSAYPRRLHLSYGEHHRRGLAAGCLPRRSVIALALLCTLAPPIALPLRFSSRCTLSTHPFGA